MEFVTVINRKKCKKIYKAIRKPIILFLLYFEIFFALFCCTVLFYPDKDYGMISFMVITTLFFIWLYVMYSKEKRRNRNSGYAQKNQCTTNYSLSRQITKASYQQNKNGLNNSRNYNDCHSYTNGCCNLFKY